jgi:hypothetical protein
MLNLSERSLPGALSWCGGSMWPFRSATSAIDAGEARYPCAEDDMWSCPKCQSKADDGFEICWACGTSRGGDEDPSFVRADDFRPKSDGATELLQKIVDDDLQFAPSPQLDVVACYWARNCNEGFFLANQLRFEGIPASADFHDLRAVFAGFGGLVPAGPYFGPRIWALAEDAPQVMAWLASYEERRKAKTKRRRG